MVSSTSLGSLGDSIGLTVMSVYALAVLQLPLTFIITINFPSVRSDFFSTTVRLVSDIPGVVNGTAIDLENPTKLHYMHSVSVSIVFLAVSGLCTVFTISTVYLRDKGLGDHNNNNFGGSSLGTEEFVSTNLDLITHPTVTMWNNVFLGIVVLGHSLLAAVVDSPTSIHLLLLVTLMIYTAMSGILQPKISVAGESNNANAASLVSSMYLGWCLLYVAAMFYVANNIPYDASSVKIQMVALVAFLDCFLLIFGHTWDHAPPMQTIMNCRLVYVVAWVFVNIATYVLWLPFISIPFVRVPN